MIATRGLLTKFRLARRERSFERNSNLLSSSYRRVGRGKAERCTTMSRWSLCISLAERRTAFEAEWHCEAQPEHASGDAQSQSVECNAQAHTFVWVSIKPTRIIRPRRLATASGQKAEIALM